MDAKELQQKLRRELCYDRETGQFSRACDGPVKKAGEHVGSLNKALGYVTINWQGKNQYAHRLAWLYEHGEMPETVDHINGDKADNRIANLRRAKQSENLQNQENRPLGGNKLRGASYDKQTGLFFGYIGHKGKTIHLGRFQSEEEAHAAYLMAKERLHTFSPKHRGAPA